MKKSGIRRKKGAKKAPSIRRGEKAPRRPLIRIKVVGVGGGGGNAVSRMGRDFGVRGIEFIAINTDLQDLDYCEADQKVHIGKFVTKGMGAGMDPELGLQAAEENRAEISEILKDADMVFIAAGFGGGTGTGAAPAIAEIARENGALTVAVVTKPFTFEGSARREIAEEGIIKLKDKVDTFLIIPNDRVFNIIDNDTPVIKAFEKIDDILKSAVQGVAEIIAATGLINVDFADVKAIMSRAGMSVIGVGTASGPERAVKAVAQATNSPLLETPIDNAKGVLFGVSGGRDLKMVEVNEAAKIIAEKADPGAKIIFGAYNDKKLKKGHMKIVLIATGFSGLTLKSEIDLSSLLNSQNSVLDFGEARGSKARNEESLNKELREKQEKSRKILGGEVPDSSRDEETWEIPAFLRRKKR
ncbi:MAG: cell division protein FtsZ [Candidatus Colwellbacteria bacterium]|nr:cell division protein FtsZ [Candidatus Colwellbacteria bacterium]